MDWSRQRDALARAVCDAESPMEALLFALLFMQDADGVPLVGDRADARWVATPQHTVLIEGGAARIDLALVRGDVHLAIEVDGHEFHERTKEQVIRDNRRQAALTALGWRVVRVSGSELWREPLEAVDRLVGLLKSFDEVSAASFGMSLSPEQKEVRAAMIAAEQRGDFAEVDRLLQESARLAREKHALRAQRRRGD